MEPMGEVELYDANSKKIKIDDAKWGVEIDSLPPCLDPDVPEKKSKDEELMSQRHCDSEAIQTLLKEDVTVEDLVRTKPR